MPKIKDSLTIEYEKYIIEYIFLVKSENEDSTYLIHQEERECRDEFAIAQYAFDWLNKFECKYGECLSINVWSVRKPHILLLNVRRDNQIRKED